MRAVLVIGRGKRECLFTTEVCTQSSEHLGFLNIKSPFNSDLRNHYLRGFWGFIPKCVHPSTSLTFFKGFIWYKESFWLESLGLASRTLGATSV